MVFVLSWFEFVKEVFTYLKHESDKLETYGDGSICYR